jgi:hypothetical protein
LINPSSSSHPSVQIIIITIIINIISMIMIIKPNAVKASIKSILHHHSSNSFTPKIVFENNSIHSPSKVFERNNWQKEEL